MQSQGGVVWAIDDEFDSHELEEEMLAAAGYSLAVTQTSSYKEDYAQFAPVASAILLQVGFHLDARAIEGLASCKAIAVRGGGYNNLDLEAATKRGIVATYVPGYCVDEASDHALALILALSRCLRECQRMTKAGEWKASKLQPIRRLRGQVLGLLGFGRIAKAVAAKAACIGLRVVAHDPLVPAQDMERLGVEAVEFDDLVKNSDFVSLHVPLSGQTHQLIDSKVLNSMKPTAYLINTCRGEVVDQPALVDALTRCKIAGAGLDVLYSEPPDPQSPLLDMPNVIVTPHSAYISSDSLREVIVRSTQAVIDVLQGRVPADVINSEVLRRVRPSTAETSPA